MCKSPLVLQKSVFFGLLCNIIICNTPHKTLLFNSNNQQYPECYTFLALLGFLLGNRPSHKTFSVPFCWQLNLKKKKKKTISFNLLFD